MKNILFYLSTTFLLCFSYSCSLMDKEPLDALPPKLYYDTFEKLESSLASIYSVLGDQALYSNEMLYRLGLQADAGYYSRETPVVGPQAYDFSSSDTRVARYWTALYSGITRANQLLANIPVNHEYDQNEINRIKGEALFLRGYYYFMLVHVYGGVPLVLEPTTDADDVDIERSDAKTVYEQILKDMIQAEEWVADITDLNYGGRVSKSTVRGILARVCLYMAGEPLKDTSKFKDAREWALKVINDKKANHSLNPFFSQVFINYAQDIYDIKESIWEVEFYAGTGFFEHGNVGYINGIRTTNADIGHSYGGLSATSKLYESYSEGDLRRDWTITSFSYNNATGEKRFINSTAPINLFARNAAKFRREYETVIPKQRTQTPQNFPLLRYSDVLLMFAEADNEVNGPTQEAIDAVNQVRQRAWSTGIKEIRVIDEGFGYTASPEIIINDDIDEVPFKPIVKISEGKVIEVDFEKDAVFGKANGSGFTVEPRIIFSGGDGSDAFAVAEIYKKSDANLTNEDIESQESLRQAIRDERFRELAFETFRKGDLIRWGVFVETMNDLGYYIVESINPNAFYRHIYLNVTEKHLLWPIPSYEMSLNKKLVQNPNW